MREIGIKTNQGVIWEVINVGRETRNRLRYFGTGNGSPKGYCQLATSKMFRIDGGNGEGRGKGAVRKGI